jgi:hypothetical protein
MGNVDENILSKIKGTKLGDIKDHVDNCCQDYVKALDGSKSASTRVRKHMLDVKELALSVRKEMLESRKK